jgi:hypothetical protein
MDDVTAREQQLAGQIREMGRPGLAVRHKNGVSRLLASRDDLRGVYAFADVVEESVRWSA